MPIEHETIEPNAQQPAKSDREPVAGRRCGNCGHSCEHGARLYGCVYEYVPCRLHGEFEHTANLCSDWVERAEVISSEQSFLQLQQIAVTLVRSHYHGGEEAFRTAAMKLAEFFDAQGEEDTVSHTIALASPETDIVPMALEAPERKLRKIALEMLSFIENMEREYPHLFDPNRKSGGQIFYAMPSVEYASRLEELGVRSRAPELGAQLKG